MLILYWTHLLLFCQSDKYVLPQKGIPNLILFAEKEIGQLTVPKFNYFHQPNDTWAFTLAI